MTTLVTDARPTRVVFERCWRIVQTRMIASGIDNLVVSNIVNFRYLTGHAPPIAISPARPWYLVLPCEGDPTAVVPTLGLHDFRAEGHAGAVIDFASPAIGPESRLSEGVAGLIEALGTQRSGTRIAIEQGFETRIGMTLDDLGTLRRELRDRPFEDAAPFLHDARAIKDELELDAIRRAVRATATTHAAWLSWIFDGKVYNERELHRSIMIDLLRQEAEAVPYLIVASGRDGYDSLTRRPTDRVISQQDVVGVDIGAAVEGYHADFNRNYLPGEGDPAILAKDRFLSRALAAGIAAVRPGVPANAVWQAMANVLENTSSMIGRLGHGVGLDLTEPPSIHPHDTTILREGMVLSVEPSLTWHDGGPKALAREEMIHVTSNGSEILTH